MNDTQVRERRTLIVTFVLAFLLGSGIFLGLLVLLGEFVIAVLATLGILFVLGLFHYFFWGRALGETGSIRRWDESSPR